MVTRELTRTDERPASSKATTSSAPPFNPRHDLTRLEMEGEADAKAWAKTPAGKASAAAARALRKHRKT